MHLNKMQIQQIIVRKLGTKYFALYVSRIQPGLNHNSM